MSSKDDRGTPLELIERVRATLGDIDLDPMSSEEFNKTVRARKIFTKEQNALSQTWQADTVYLNPPGSLRIEAHKKFIQSFEDGIFRAGCICLYDWDHSTRWFGALLEAPCSIVFFEASI